MNASGCKLMGYFGKLQSPSKKDYQGSAYAVRIATEYVPTTACCPGKTSSPWMNPLVDAPPICGSFPGPDMLAEEKSEHSPVLERVPRKSSCGTPYLECLGEPDKQSKEDVGSQRPHILSEVLHHVLICLLEETVPTWAIRTPEKKDHKQQTDLSSLGVSLQFLHLIFRVLQEVRQDSGRIPVPAPQLVLPLRLVHSLGQFRNVHHDVLKGHYHERTLKGEWVLVRSVGQGSLTCGSFLNKAKLLVEIHEVWKLVSDGLDNVVQQSQLLVIGLGIQQLKQGREMEKRRIIIKCWIILQRCY